MNEHRRDTVPLPQRARLRWELAIVLALSFGYAGARAIITILERLAQDTALENQTATIHRPLSSQQYFDLAYQLLGIIGGLAPVALVVFLLWRTQRPHLGDLGLGARRDAGTRPADPSSFAPMRSGRGWPWLSETGNGFVLAAVIGIPGLGFYLFAKWIGINTTVVPTTLDAFWWTVPVLILQALRAALSEELIVVAYLFDRLKRLGVGPWATIIASALLRGSYHLYQGFGGFIGNVVMGVVFGWAYQRWGRALPLIVAHLLLDIVSFVGYPLALALWPSLFG
ncbi:CPBP family intramembrane glutamic endopeptidase [Leucobacter komagatae]|uniref:CPBP family intramembrane glutamic endopeptidase n=1 Tax=Leucobacter komagatae TaxID=55969 RepID=UPI0005ACA2B0|nr:type II CAAX endopeptidase family protein [Leucobacter komagatae]